MVKYPRTYEGGHAHPSPLKGERLALRSLCKELDQKFEQAGQLEDFGHELIETRKQLGDLSYFAVEFTHRFFLLSLLFVLGSLPLTYILYHTLRGMSIGFAKKV
jgi:hypothetical protein